MTDEGTLLGRFMPGDYIRARVEITVPMNLTSIRVWFENTEDPDRAISLMETFEEVLDRGDPESPYVADLKGAVTHDVTPGLYRLYRVAFETYAGRVIRIDGDQLGDLRHYNYMIEVVPEPADPPRVMGFELD